VFIVAQGLLMYLQPAMVRDLIGAIAGRFPTVDMVFDVVPAWFSSLTLQGLWQTPRYRLPAMPWGINRDAIEPTLHSWLNGRLGVVTFLPYSQPRGMPSSLGSLIKQMPVVRHAVPSLVHLSMKAGTGGNTVISEPVVFGGASTSSVQATGGPHCPSARRSEMNAIAPNETLSGVMAAATRHAGDHSDLAVAAAGVVAKRVALGLAAAFDPLSANHAEFERMVPEKLEAFSAAGLIMLKTSGEASLQMTRLASDAAVTTATATMAMTRCSTPAALLEAQRLFAVGWFERAASAFAAMGMLTLGVQAAAMSPIRQTVTANAKRLGG
jgi:hypothetical protein